MGLFDSVRTRYRASVLRNDERWSVTRGIYSIRNLVTGDLYIGSSANVERRLQDHRDALLRGRYFEKNDQKLHLQRAWEKYGSDQFEFKCIDEVPEDRNLIEVEQWWLDVFWPTGYNTSKSAGKPPHFDDLSPELQERFRERIIEVTKRPEVRQKMREAWTQDRREEQRQRSLGRQLSRSQLEYLRSEVHRQQIREGISRLNDEQRDRRRLNSSLSWTSEKREAARDRNTGRKLSTEPRQKQSEQRKRWWRRKKGDLSE